MQSLRNSCGSRRINQVYSLGCFPGSFAFRRPVRSIVNEKIANARFIAKAKLLKIREGAVCRVLFLRRQSNSG
jgi:hypothetical protein